MTTPEFLPPPPQPAVDATLPSFVERHRINPMLFGFAVLIVVFVLYQIGGGVLAYVLGGGVVTRENVVLQRFLTMGGQIVLMLLPTLGAARLLSSSLRTVFPIRAPSIPELGYALLALFSLQRLMDVYLFFQDLLPMPPVIRDTFGPLKELLEGLVKTLVTAQSIPELLFVLLVVAAVPAVVEEFLFRGLIQRSFERVMSGTVAAVFAGMIFGLYHLNPMELIPLMGLGVFFGLLRYRSRTMSLPILGHFLNNAMAVMAVYLGMDTDASPPASALSIRSMAFQAVIFAVLFVAFLIAYWRATEQTARAVPQ